MKMFIIIQKRDEVYNADNLDRIFIAADGSSNDLYKDGEENGK